MTILKQALLVGFLALTFIGFTHAAVTDPYLGDYWYDLIRNNANGGVPVTQVGEMDFTSSSVTWDYYASPTGTVGSSSFNYTNPSLDEDQYLTLQVVPSGSVKFVVNGDMAIRLSETVTSTDPLAHALMVRKAENVTTTDITGDYAFFRHAMNGSPSYTTEGAFGTASFSTGSPNSWSADFDLLRSAVPKLVNVTPSGNWTLDAQEGIVTVDGLGTDDLLFKVGEGGLMTSTVVNGVTDTLARTVLVKKGTGQTVADLWGTYTLQSFDSHTDGSEFWTTWGTLVITPGEDPDTGQWATTTSNSTGAVDAESNGTFTVDDDGTLHITDWADTPMSGVVNMDQDMLVISGLNSVAEDVGIMFAIRTSCIVPEPTTLALLLLGSLCALAGWFLRRS